MESGGMVRSEKVQRIFEEFDSNKDGGLNREEMTSLVVAVNPRVKFTPDQISAILDEVFRTYSEFISPNHGLTFPGLLRTYDDGAGDVDRDFEALSLHLPSSSSDPTQRISIASQDNDDDHLLLDSAQKKKQSTAPPWSPSSPNPAVLFEDTWKLVDAVEKSVKKLKSKQVREGRGGAKGDTLDISSEAGGWSAELGFSSEIAEKGVLWVESGKDYTVFLKELTAVRADADAARSREEAFEGQMGIGRVLYQHKLFKEALVSFKRACELQPVDVRPHFKAGNCFYLMGREGEAKEEFVLALEAAENGGSQWAALLPQIHVNIGISLEAEGMVLGACEHYREAAIFCPTHVRALKLLGSALLGVGDYTAAIKALEEATRMKTDYADAHCDLASALHSVGEEEKAIAEFQKAIDLKPGHVEALFNLGGLYMDMGRYHRATEMYTRVLVLCPTHWGALLNRAVSLLGDGETLESRKALKEAFRACNRVELHDAMLHLKQLERRRNKKNKKKKKGEDDKGEEEAFLTVEASRFQTVGGRTASMEEMRDALRIREFQRTTKLNLCDVGVLVKEMKEEESLPVSYSGAGVPERSMRRASVEVILRRLLHFTKPEGFQVAVRAINKTVISIMEECGGGGRVDVGMFLAVIAIVCGGEVERRKKAAFDALLWRPGRRGEGSMQEVRKGDVVEYLRVARAVYLPPKDTTQITTKSGKKEEEDEEGVVSVSEFMSMFDDKGEGMGGIMPCLMKLEGEDRSRHGNLVCSACEYPVVGCRFKEVRSHFTLCAQCYSQGKVPAAAVKMDHYRFKQHGMESSSGGGDNRWTACFAF